MRPQRETRREEEGVQDGISVQHVQEEELLKERRPEAQKVKKGGVSWEARGESVLRRNKMVPCAHGF